MTLLALTIGLYNSRHTFALPCVSLGSAKSGFGEAGLKDLALVNGQPRRGQLT